jgi:xanthine dehydrogenase accessory factor
MLRKAKIFIIGAGDKGTTTALRIFRSGFRPVLLEQKHPSDLHSFRNFSDVVYLGKKEIDDVLCRAVELEPDLESMSDKLSNIRADRQIPMVILPDLVHLTDLNPEIIIDCRGGAKAGEDFAWSDFPCVIRIGPAYQVGRDGHFVIGSGGNELGKVFRKSWELEHHLSETQFISNAPFEGVFVTFKSIGDTVSEKEIIGQLNDINILAPRAGILTGLLHSGHFVQLHGPIFEIKPGNLSDKQSRHIPVACLSISGGVLEAVLTFLSENRSAM